LILPFKISHTQCQVDIFRSLVGAVNLGLSPTRIAGAIFRLKVPLTWEDRALSRACPRQFERHFQVKTTGRRAKITVSADESGIVSQAGGLLLASMFRDLDALG
jgi:hypothetical protein